MLRLGEVGGEARAADQLGRRIGDPQLRVALLQREELVEHRVEFGVRDDRRVLDVVAELVFPDRFGQVLPLPPDLGRYRISFC
ncbi:hypothetical protein MINTM019_39020 [Mycobacterium paraintracellulare]|nr:hypothetical protein MINTM019_39020 [Mycobacterium paraintracellulare]BCP11513.1 hypothetical protein MINTM020_36110 [Mycobacterium paraintracellulare]